MWKWLRSWFAWQFSLRRLVIATVFLGAVVGLNAQKIGPLPTGYFLSSDAFPVIYARGWPFPFLEELAYVGESDAVRVLGVEPQNIHFSNDWFVSLQDRALPWTHQGYRLLDLSSLGWQDTVIGRIAYGAIDALFAFTMPFLILFLQIPRRRPEPEGAR
jgi:hypothetical protein